MRRRRVRWFVALAASAAMVIGVMPLASAETDAVLDEDTEFFVPRPQDGAKEEIAALRAAGEAKDAALIEEMVAYPQVVWFEGGTSGARHSAHHRHRQRADRCVPVGEDPG